MPDLYGSWLQKDFDYSCVSNRISGLHDEYYEKFKRRVDSIYNLAIIYSEYVGEKHPDLKSHVFVSYPAVLGSTGRYINDIVHYKIWHQISVANRAKMIAHMIKWLSFYPVVTVNLSKEDYKNLNEDSRKMALDINLGFIALIIKWVVDYFSPGSVADAEKKYKKVYYLLETGQFEAKNASMVFDGVL